MEDHPRSSFARFMKQIFYMIDAPVTWFRENVVVPNRPTFYYYHRRFRRVPTIDECEEQDAVCMYEAQEQFLRDRKVDTEVINILRGRIIECEEYEFPDEEEHCKKIQEQHDEAVLNFFIKYGDLGAFPHAKNCYMKQKHRMVHERRKAEGKV